MAETKYPFYKPVPKDKLGLRTEWKLHEGAQGCTAVEGVCLRYDKTPPPLAGSPPPPKPEPVKATTAAAPKAPEKPNWQKLIDWATEDKPKEQKKKEIPPFDLRDIPKAMEAMGWKIAAKLAQRWLDGKYHRIPADAKDYVYPDDMVDTDTVTLDWLLGFKGVREEYNKLIPNLRTNNAITVLKDSIREFLATNRRFSGTLSTLEYCGDNFQKLHNTFQFQKQYVSAYAGLSAEAIERQGMTDVTASLASFNFYATVARAEIQTDVYNRYNTPKGTVSCTRSRVKITHIYVHARDSYSFQDKGKSSQYLGHWNKTGVIAVPAAFALSYAMAKIDDNMSLLHGTKIESFNETIPNLPVDLRGLFRVEDIYYPIRNRDYLIYQETHHRGGDFVIYSDRKMIKLETPIYLDMGEVCQ